jgi:hypothetical protein
MSLTETEAFMLGLVAIWLLVVLGLAGRAPRRIRRGALLRRFRGSR